VETQLSTPQRTAAFFRPLLKPCRFEHCIAIHFNADWHVIDTTYVTSGAGSYAHMPVRQLVEEALACDASAVVLVHNHPSGIAEPSDADCALTRRVADTLHALDIRLVDHVIVAGSRWTSFRELGLL
jgi:DNA repair protein RadC